MIPALGSIDARHREILESARELSAGLGAAAYLVGGPVRDLLLDLPIRDLDIACDRLTTEVARAMAARLGAAVRETPAFLTCKLQLPDGSTIDLATTRGETYAHPGALPRVFPSAIEEDLQRRDFSINAMAIDLATWELLDPARGLLDLRARMIRILHPRSFEDDPTRIFRAIRFAERLRFTIEPFTDGLIDRSILSGALETVSLERLWRELLLVISEKEPSRALSGLARRGALARVAGVGERLTEPELLEAATPHLGAHGDDRRIVCLGLLLAGISDPEDAAVRLPLKRSEASTVARIAGDPRRLARELSAASDGERFDLCLAASPEERVVALAADPHLADLLGRFEEIAAAELGVAGDDLGVPPGPWVGKAFEDARRSLFRGSLTMAEVPAFARQAALKYLKERDPKG